MRVIWTGTQCLFCLEARPLTVEHLIPRALGGALTCRFLCNSCNSRFGSHVEAAARSDPAILQAVRQLQADIPELAQTLIESHPHVTTGKGPPAVGYVSDGQFRVNAQQLDDGSLILPTDDARHAIANIMMRDGYGDAPIRQALRTWERMPENERLSIADGLDVVKWSTEGIKLDFGRSKPIDPLLPAKIAFEFLALCAGDAMCSNYPPLPGLREVLATGTRWDDNILRVERLQAANARPFHGICNEENPAYSQVQVRLFGCLAYRVHFPRLRVGGTRYAYTQTLDTGQEDLRFLNGGFLPDG